jgi:hypothetical protein
MSLKRFATNVAKRALKAVQTSGGAKTAPSRKGSNGKGHTAVPQKKFGGPAASAAPTAPGKLQIAYAPALDGDGDPGEVVWAWIPYEDDPTQGKDRPCLVIGHLDGRLATVALTSKASGPERDRFSVGVGEWDRERRPSYAKIDRVIALDPKSVRREGAIFPRDRFDKVVAATAARKPDIQFA